MEIASSLSDDSSTDETDILLTIGRLQRRRRAERRTTLLAVACACLLVGASAREIAVATLRPDPVPAYRTSEWQTRCGVLLDEYGRVLDGSPAYPVYMWD